MKAMTLVGFFIKLCKFFMYGQGVKELNYDKMVYVGNFLHFFLFKSEQKNKGYEKKKNDHKKFTKKS